MWWFSEVPKFIIIEMLKIFYYELKPLLIQIKKALQKYANIIIQVEVHFQVQGIWNFPKTLNLDKVTYLAWINGFYE